MEFLEQADYIGYVIKQLLKCVRITRLPYILGFYLEVPPLVKNLLIPATRESSHLLTVNSSPDERFIPPLNNNFHVITQ